METQIVELWPLGQFRYVRESERALPALDNQFLIHTRHRMGPDGSATLGYSVDDRNQTVRYWWVWQPSQLDGIDPPHHLDKTAFKLVDPSSIKPNVPSAPWRPLSAPSLMHGRLVKRPARLMDRWAIWEQRHKPRVLPTRWQRFTCWLRRRCTVPRSWRAFPSRLWAGFRQYVLRRR